VPVFLCDNKFCDELPVYKIRFKNLGNVTKATVLIMVENITFFSRDNLLGIMGLLKPLDY